MDNLQELCSSYFGVFLLDIAGRWLCTAALERKTSMYIFSRYIFVF